MPTGLRGGTEPETGSKINVYLSDARYRHQICFLWCKETSTAEVSVGGGSYLGVVVGGVRIYAVLALNNVVGILRITCQCVLSSAQGHILRGIKLVTKGYGRARQDGLDSDVDNVFKYLR